MNSLAVSQSKIGCFLPQDLIEYIWQFNYLHASNIIRKYTKKYISNKVKELSNMMHFIGSTTDLGYGAKNYRLFYNNNILSNREILNTFNACKCCSRHKINKPHSLAPWNDTVTNMNRENHKCECECRHMARFICRYVE